MGIESLQAFLRTAGALGVWVYTFTERILIPAGLHHFVYGPFIFGPAAVEGGIQVYWAQHLQEFSQSTVPLKTLFPEGGFSLHGNSKVFGSVGIALAIWHTASPENRVKVAGLLIPATLTAVLVGITEPLEFTFLFISPLLFAIHAVLAATMATVMYTFGVVGNMGAVCWTSSCRKTGSRCSITTPRRYSPRLASASASPLSISWFSGRLSNV